MVTSTFTLKWGQIDLTHCKGRTSESLAMELAAQWNHLRREYTKLSVTFKCQNNIVKLVVFPHRGLNWIYNSFNFRYITLDPRITFANKFCILLIVSNQSILCGKVIGIFAT